MIEENILSFEADRKPEHIAQAHKAKGLMIALASWREIFPSIRSPLFLSFLFTQSLNHSVIQSLSPQIIPADKISKLREG